MKEIIKTVTETKTIEKKVIYYVASDGTEFTSKEECKFYEEKMIYYRDDIVVFDTLTDCVPFFYDENYRDYSYHYIMPKTETAAREIGNLFETNMFPNKIYCIEDAGDWVDVYPIDELKQQIKDFFNRMNITVNFS